ncbi:MAG: Kelch repeat-containing protein [Planctomycetota bacterium]|jgi:N-acetylneuraminic acid mutarotase
MKSSNDYRVRLMLIGLVAAVVLGGRIVKADFTWARMTDMPINKVDFSTSVVGGKIYAIGGWHAIGGWNPPWKALTRVDEYDPTTDTWTRKADMPTRRGTTFTCVVNDKIYVLGGDVSGPISIVEVYDPATDTWQEQTDVPLPRYTPAPSVVDGIIYVMGGKGKTENLDWGQFPANMVDAYDPATDTWTRKADMPTPRWMQSSCAANGKIYVIGGMTSGGATAAMEEYDPMTDAWTVKAPMPTPRYGVGTCFLEGKICVIGGWRHSINGPIYSTVEVYDPKTDIWTRGIDIPITTAIMSTSVVDDKIYVFGGTTATHKNEYWALTSAVYASEPILDFNGDGIIDVKDIVIMTHYWGSRYTLCDIDPTPLGDGIVDVRDLLVLAEYIEPEEREPGLIAHWKLDETEGGIVYDSVSGENAFIISEPQWQPNGGILDGALELDGIEDCISTDFILNPADGPFSVFAWVKDGAPGQVVFSQLNGANWLGTDPDLGCLMTELMAPAVGRFTPQPLISEYVITDGQWHRIGLVWDGSNRTLYVDSVIVAEDTQNGLANAFGGLYIGCGKSREPGSFFSGLIDDIRIYNRAVYP